MDVEQQCMKRITTGHECTDKGVGDEGVWFGNLRKQAAGIGEGSVGRKGTEGEDAGRDKVVSKDAGGDRLGMDLLEMFHGLAGGELMEWVFREQLGVWNPKGSLFVWVGRRDMDLRGEVKEKGRGHGRWKKNVYQLPTKI